MTLAVAMATCGCSNDESTTEPVVPKYPITFSQPQYDEVVTRASSLSDINTTFGVYGYYEDAATDGTVSSHVEFMSNQKVDYTNSAWTYNPPAYWNDSYSQTSFYAWSPFSSGSFDYSTKVLTLNSTISGNYSGEEVLYASATIAKDDYKKSVNLQFKHFQAQVCMEFVTDITNYDVEITDNITATPSTGFISNYSSFTIPFGTNGSYGIATTSTDALSFNNPSGNISTTTDSYTASPTVYYAVPQTSSDLSFTVTIPLKLTPTTFGHTETSYTATATIPATSNGTSLTQWQSGYRYVYRFNISSSGVKLLLTQVYKPDGNGHYLPENSTTISIGEEDTTKGADAKHNIH